MTAAVRAAGWADLEVGAHRNGLVGVVVLTVEDGLAGADLADIDHHELGVVGPGGVVVHALDHLIVEEGS